MDNVMAGLHQPQPFLYIVKDAWKPFLSSRNGLCQVDSLTAPPADTTQREVTRSCALREKDQTAYVTWSRKYSVHSLAAQKRRAGVMATAGARACPKGARARESGLQAGSAPPKSGLRGLPKLSKHDHLILKCPKTHEGAQLGLGPRYASSGDMGGSARSGGES